VKIGKKLSNVSTVINCTLRKQKTRSNNYEDIEENSTVFRYGRVENIANYELLFHQAQTKANKFGRKCGLVTAIDPITFPAMQRHSFVFFFGFSSFFFGGGGAS